MISFTTGGSIEFNSFVNWTILATISLSSRYFESGLNSEYYELMRTSSYSLAVMNLE